ncbi:hypothetical protein EON64_18255 [archaeon]|nr:MAG: hypothetical protein EON64_18255 [archaeon]
MRELRRFRRNQQEAEKFLAERAFRLKRDAVKLWAAFKERRVYLRLVFIAVELRASMANYAVFFDHWKAYCLSFRHAITLQRLHRGHVARKRSAFISRLQRRVLAIQKTARQFRAKQATSRTKTRLAWAATTIQRVVRGRHARLKVATMVQEEYDRYVLVYDGMFCVNVHCMCN